MKTFKLGKPTKYGANIYVPAKTNGEISVILMNSDYSMAARPDPIISTNGSMKEVRKHYSGVRLDKVDELELDLRTFEVFKSGFLYYNLNTKSFYIVRKYTDGKTYIFPTEWLKRYDFDDERLYKFPAGVANKKYFRLVLY